MEVSRSMPLSHPSMMDPSHYGMGLLLADEQKLVDVEQPHHNDVLSGRGVTTNRHPGNESFRSLVALNKELYVTSTKRQKMSISRSIVDAVRSLDPPGRFLEKDPKTGLWSDIGHKKAVEKTSQALRDGAASLRKQLSADMGDPEFLNEVFGDNERKDRDAKSSSINENDIDGNKKKVSEIDSREMQKLPDTAMQKDKMSTAKKCAIQTKQAPIKKGHRRTRSNPCSGTATTKHNKKVKPTGPPPSPLSRFEERYPRLPSAPMSPPLRQVASQPNSPMTWDGRIPHRENENPFSLGQVPSSPQYEYSPQSPRSYPQYSHRSHTPRYGRSHSHEYPLEHPAETPSHLETLSNHVNSCEWYQRTQYYQPPSPTHSSSVSSRGHHAWPVSHPGASTPTRPPRPPSPPQSSTLPKGALPPGRHQFSPAGYTSTPPGPDWYDRNERSYHHSPRSYYHEHSYPSEQSPRWRSPYAYDQYSTPPPSGYGTSVSYSPDDSESSGLSVPSLGVDTRYSQRRAGSSRVELSPKSCRGGPPPRPPAASARDFAPPPPTPRFRHIGSPKAGYSHPWEREETYRSSPLGEEKKTEEEQSPPEEEEKKGPYPFAASSSCVPEVRYRRLSPTAHERIEEEDDDDEDSTDFIDRSDDIASVVRSSPASLRRASPLSTLICDVAVGTESPAQVDEIAMSPIPMDREDPTTLMELPENLLTLPISPYGPHDDPRPT